MSYFTGKELSCSCCGVNAFNKLTLDRLNALRKELGQPLIVNSAYRCEKHNALRGYTQTHATGQAIDLNVSHKIAYDVLELAIKHGFTGIGIKQKGKVRFIHLDDLEEGERRPRPHIWSY